MGSRLRIPSGFLQRRKHHPRWRERYAGRLRVSDLLVLVWAVYGTQLVWFGAGSAQVAIRADSRLSEVSYWLFSAVLVLAWMWSLSLIDSRSYRVIGTGATEYIRVIHASVALFGLIAILAFLARVDVARGYLLIALPLGIFVLVLERWLWRQWLNAKRSAGEYSARVLLVGSRESVAQIARELQRSSSAGYRVVGACVPSGKVAETIAGTDVPIMGNVNAIERAIAATGADTVAVTSTDDLPPNKVKQISWSLEAGRQHLVLAPSITDIAGPRIHTRPVSGLPLIHVETPRFSNGQRFVKRTVDLAAATLGVVVISPVLAFLAISVRLSGPGPILFRQTRVGLGGHEFRMLKFRSMVPNAEQLLEQLIPQNRDSGNEVLFKMKNDPRVTRIGQFMRRYSLDELPQLFNVIGGTMSLVGPRPSLPTEVAQYADHVHRRFLAKPGITGLWQVSGRSSLSWEESVRLDLSYVENWSLLGDIVILLKTGKAALLPGDTAH
ncbi:MULTISPECIES: sugar transferase [unclassified Microbacterium]|uniref:sugar transferase n=1 Tax=unclassified Microbacterium TaxID=2609290 RepID=UPI00214D0003|nr:MULTISPECIES: sugar transferase [unclassified Microbacterium]MCR2808905.1 sugar transferase [Microbacterium sp. zg.B185]WIM20899.1 sugar transferase [Microbacterium sp. zg-B185]